MSNVESIKSGSFERRKRLFICLALAALTLAVYWQVSSFSFVDYDDHIYVSENDHVKRGLSEDSIIWAFTTGHSANWHPLTWLSHMVDYELFGMNAGRHHLTNLFFHIANTLLLFLLLCRLTGAEWRSGFVAALFALHPLHVESVAWVAERKDVLSTFFWLLAIWSYAWYAQRPGILRHLVVLIFLAFGLMAKPMLVTLPFVFLLLDYWPLRRFHLSGSDNESASSDKFPLQLLWEKIPFFLLMAASCLVTYFVQQRGGAVSTLDAFPLGLRIENAVASYVIYIGKMLWPSHLAVFYPHPEAIPWWMTVGASIFLVGVTLLVLRFLRSRPYLAVGWFIYLGTIVPVIGLVQVGSQALADRYTYVPLIGLFIMLAWLVPELVAERTRLKTTVAVAAAVIVLVLAASTWKQLHYWTDTISLFGHAIRVTENNYIAQDGLGSALLEKGKIDEALSHIREAVRINPNHAQAQYNLGVALTYEQKTDDSIDHFRRAVQLDPEYEKAYNNLGEELIRKGQMSEAILALNEALRINPEDAKVHNNLAIALRREGRIEEALSNLREAIRIDPDFSDAHSNLGSMLATKGNIDEAVRHFAAAVHASPDSAKAHYNLGSALAMQGRFDDAIREFREALRIEPGFAEARDKLEQASAVQTKIDASLVQTRKMIEKNPNDPALYVRLGDIYNERGDPDEALDDYRKALSLKPDFVQALNGMAIVHAKKGEYAEAIDLFKKIIAYDEDNPSPYYNIACTYAKVNKADAALQWLKKAIDRGFQKWELIKQDKDLENIRGLPAFQEMIKNR